VIELALSHGRNAMAIWQELVDTCGFAAEYKSVTVSFGSFVEANRRKHAQSSKLHPVKNFRSTTAPARWWRDPHTSKYRRTRLFVLTLGYSRKSVRLLVFRSSSQIWAELHEKAFRRLGGCTRVVVLDNLREAYSRLTSMIPR